MFAAEDEGRLCSCCGCMGGWPSWGAGGDIILGGPWGGPFGGGGGVGFDSGGYVGDMPG